MDESFSLAVRKAMLDALADTGGPLEAPTLILFSNEGSINPRTVIGDLTECVFTGYAAEAGITFGAAYQDDADNVKMSAPSVQFTATASTTEDVATGWALTNVGKTVLYYAKKLDTPFAFNEAGDALIVQPTVQYGF